MAHAIQAVLATRIVLNYQIVYSFPRKYHGHFVPGEFTHQAWGFHQVAIDPEEDENN